MLVNGLDQKLRSVLARRGANETQAKDLIADLWSDCFTPSGNSRLLLKYSGKSSLDTWLATVLTHRWLDRVRRERRIQQLEFDSQNVEQSGLGNRTSDPDLETLLYNALQYGFSRCDPESLVMLQLVHVHGISQRQVAFVWGISEFKISRRLSKTVQSIRKLTVTWLREQDPLLDFGWDDVVELCSAGDLFKSDSVAPRLRLKNICKNRTSAPSE